VSHGASPDRVFGPSGMLAAVALSPVWTVSQPGGGRNRGLDSAAEFVVGGVLDGEVVVVVGGALDGEAVVVVAHSAYGVPGGDVSLGM
jgi:hypothetical protein